MEKLASLDKLPQPLSVYMDSLRVFAALLVMVSHYPLTASLGNILAKKNFSYDAVVVFFVLSGYVISYAANVIEGSPKRYVVSRVARIFPVAVAAIVISAIFLKLVGASRPDLYLEIPELGSWPEIAIRSITFTNQAWNDNIVPFDNGPYWSLSFEVWCYVFYGFFIFTSGLVRWIVLILLCALLGPKQIMILPMWVAGSMAYHLRHLVSIRRSTALVLAVIPVALYVLFQMMLPRDWSYPYAGSKVEGVIGFGLDGAANFGWGYILAAIFAIHLFSVGKISQGVNIDEKLFLVKFVRFLAGYTFTLYIIHGPVIKFTMSVFGIGLGDYSFQSRFFIYVVVFASAYIVGTVVEHKKNMYRSWVDGIISAIQQIFKRSVKA